MKTLKLPAALLVALSLTAAAPAADKDERPVHLITLDPGHFHAALVQKFMLPGVAPKVHVFGPEGEDVPLHLKRIEGFNSRAENPTRWQTVVYQHPDYFERALVSDLPKPAIVVISGNNARKDEYITKCIEAGYHVLADKPMVILPKHLPQLEADFTAAAKKGVLLYDIMTERYEIASMLQKALSQQAGLFGTLEKGSAKDPSITKVSVHHFSKVVAGSQLKRPQWFFDPEQQGAGIVDVMTHLVDLVQWAAFPEVALAPADARVHAARRWTTPLTLEQFGKVTGAKEFPAYLHQHVKHGVLHAPANGEISYTLRGVHAHTSVKWDFEAPPGGGDTHFSVMRGTKATLTIKQGAEQKFRPTLYVEPAKGVAAADHEKALRAAVANVAKSWPGIDVKAIAGGFEVLVPDSYHNGHEAHFGQVTEAFLGYVRAGKLPEWEVPNMITKYATIMKAYELSK
jgi:predicted dehydrogenase